MNSKTRLRTTGRWAILGVLLLWVVVVRCWNIGDVFVLGQVFYVDPDCYSRMSRVALVAAEPGTVVRHQAFENWPDGTVPHTTAPLDYLIWIVGRVAGWGITQGSLDLAGAMMPVLLALGTAVFFWRWSRGEPLLYRAGMLFFFAVSPMLVHGTLLGRPDHQSLLILLLAIALGAEAKGVATGGGQRWHWVAGGAWGLACWVSLYEPLVLLATTLVLLALVDRAGLKRRWQGGVIFVGVLVLALGIEGWRSPVPDEVTLAFFPSWAQSIGEMQALPFWNPIWLAWTWLWLPLTALLLLARKDRIGLFWLGLLVVCLGLSLWQARWGYFLSLVFVMSLPAQWHALERWVKGWRWAVAGVTLVGLWPVAMEWDRKLTNPDEALRRHERKIESLALLETAAAVRSEVAVPVLAPWWLSPAFAYWSGHPCVAGSSHQSLPGIVQSARFYTSTDPEAALYLLDQRGVQYVLAYEPDRVLATSNLLLKGDATIPGDAKETLAYWLYRHPDRPPDGLELVWMNQTFRLYRRVLE